MAEKIQLQYVPKSFVCQFELYLIFFFFFKSATITKSSMNQMFQKLHHYITSNNIKMGVCGRRTHKNTVQLRRLCSSHSTIGGKKKSCTVMFTDRRICTVGLEWDNNCLMDWQNWTSSYYFCISRRGRTAILTATQIVLLISMWKGSIHTHTSQLYTPNFATSALIMNYSVIWHRECFPHSNLRWEVPRFSSPVDPRASVGQVSRWRISRPTADQWANSPLHAHPHSSGTN